jgi:hypothetical protein
VLNLDSSKTEAPHIEAEELADVVTVVNAGGSLQDPLAVHSLDRGQGGLFRCREAFRLWQEFAREFRFNPYFRAEAKAKAGVEQTKNTLSQASSPGGNDAGATEEAPPNTAGSEEALALLDRTKAKRVSASPGSLRAPDLGLGPDAAAEIVRVGHAINLPKLVPGKTVGDVPGMPELCSRFNAFTVTRDEAEEGANEVKREPWRSWRSIQARHGKATLDFALALDFCANSVGAEYAFILEDDSLMARSWLTKLDQGVMPAAEAFAVAEEAKNPMGSEAAPADQDVPRQHGYDADTTEDAAPLLSAPVPIPAGSNSLFTPLAGTSDIEAITQGEGGRQQGEDDTRWRREVFVENRRTALQRRVAWVKLFYPDFLEQWGLADVAWLTSWACAWALAAVVALSALLGVIRVAWSPVRLRAKRANATGGAAKDAANCCVCGVLRSMDQGSLDSESVKRHALSLERASGCGCSGIATHRSRRWIMHCQPVLSIARLLVCCCWDQEHAKAPGYHTSEAGAEIQAGAEAELPQTTRGAGRRGGGGGGDTPASPVAVLSSHPSSGDEDTAVGRRRGASSRLGTVSTHALPPSHEASSAGMEVVGCVCPASRDVLLSMATAAVLAALVFLGIGFSAGKSTMRTMPWQRAGVHSFTTGCCIVGTVFPRTSAMQLAWEMRTYWAHQAELSDFSLTFAGLAFHSGKLRILATPHLVQHVGFVSTQPFSDLSQSWTLKRTHSGQQKPATAAAPAAQTPRPKASPAPRTHLAKAFFERFNLPEPTLTWDEPSPSPSPTPSNAPTPSPPDVQVDGSDPPEPTPLEEDLLGAPTGGAAEEDVLRWGWRFWDGLQWSRRFYNGFFGFSFAFDEPECDAVEVGLPPGKCQKPRW